MLRESVMGSEHMPSPENTWPSKLEDRISVARHTGVRDERNGKRGGRPSGACRRVFQIYLPELVMCLQG
jgi:hypothetical protein